jgi:hypothetical protein
MKAKLIILTSLNLLASLLLFIIYFFRFDIQWGFYAESLTWGLPILLGAVITLAAGLYTWKTKLFKWGLSGLGAAAIAGIYTAVMLISFSYVMLPGYDVNEQGDVDTTENTILSLVLADIADRFEDGKYIVVDANTTYRDIEATRVNEYLKEQQHSDFTNLISLLSENNREQHRLAIDSSIENGYYIDHNEIFFRHFTNSSGYLRTNIFHPQVSSFVKISLLAFEDVPGYVLVYIESTSNILFRYGGGSVIHLYEYSGGELTLIDLVPIAIK